MSEVSQFIYDEKNGVRIPVGAMYAYKNDDDVVCVGFSVLNKHDDVRFACNCAHCNKNNKTVVFDKSNAMRIAKKRADKWAEYEDVQASVNKFGSKVLLPDAHYKEVFAEKQERSVMRSELASISKDLDLPVPEWSTVIIPKRAYDAFVKFIIRCRKVYRDDSKYAPWIYDFEESYIKKEIENND